METFPAFEVENHAKQLSIMITFALEYQIIGLLDSDAARLFATSVSSYLLSIVDSGEVRRDPTDELCDQLLRKLFTFEKLGFWDKFKLRKNYIPTSVAAKWTSRDLLQCALLATTDGQCYAHVDGCSDNTFNYRVVSKVIVDSLDGCQMIPLQFNDIKQHELYDNHYWNPDILKTDAPRPISMEEFCQSILTEHAVSMIRLNSIDIVFRDGYYWLHLEFSSDVIADKKADRAFCALSGAVEGKLPLIDSNTIVVPSYVDTIDCTIKLKAIRNIDAKNFCYALTDYWPLTPAKKVGSEAEVEPNSGSGNILRGVKIHAQ